MLLLTFIIWEWDLNFPLLQCWWQNFSSGVVVFVLKQCNAKPADSEHVPSQ
jgi:hypothetical protein